MELLDFATKADKFKSPYDQYKNRIGQPFQYVRMITTENLNTQPDKEKFDSEVLPMYEIKFQDGEVILAWPEEVLDIPPRLPLINEGDTAYEIKTGKRTKVVILGVWDKEANAYRIGWGKYGCGWDTQLSKTKPKK